MRRWVAVFLAVATVVMTGACASFPAEPSAVGDDYPGTCLPAELSWPTDFLESLPGESPAVAGSVVGLRLEYLDAQWVWRLRSAATKTDVFGETVDDESFGMESIVDARTLSVVDTQDATLTPAEQTLDTSAYDAAQQAGEQWPSPLIIEMTRVIDAGVPVWRVTTCDTATNTQTVITVP